MLHVDAVQSDLVCRLPRKLNLSPVIWHTPEAIYLQLVSGCVQGDVMFWLGGVATNWNSSWGNNYISAILLFKFCENLLKSSGPNP